MAQSHIDNSTIAEWLALEAERHTGTLHQALRRASRKAFLWPEEVLEILRAGRSLTELPGIGPFLAKVISQWIEKPPPKAKPPPLRLNFLTLAHARRLLKTTPLPPFRGDLQMHSVWSDGSGTIRDMANAGQARGYEFIAITDHSKGLKIAGGIDEGELEDQAREIETLNQELGASDFRVLKGIELNLNPRGAGDMAIEVLEDLDLVVGSFHSRLRVSEDQTERYLAALQNPQVQILGHPRGRIYNHRLGLTADWPRVFAMAAKLDKAVEIDSYPDRQDLDFELLKSARDAGVKLAIDTDAHHPEQLDFIELGLGAAVLVKYPQKDIINFWPVEKLLAWAKQAKNVKKEQGFDVSR
jgi:histidinol phosphatase-like PHP family hydrolase